jgi:integrase/recombinase XerD
LLDHIPYARREDTLSTVLTPDEVLRLLRAAPDLKTRTALTTIYAAGLRISEVVALTAADINSARMIIEVRQGKGQKDRYVMLSEQLLTILRAYWPIASTDMVEIGRGRRVVTGRVR